MPADEHLGRWMALPMGVHVRILTELDLLSLARFARSCKLFHSLSFGDRLWCHLIRRRLRVTLSHPRDVGNARQVFIRLRAAFYVHPTDTSVSELRIAFETLARLLREGQLRVPSAAHSWSLAALSCRATQGTYDSAVHRLPALQLEPHLATDVVGVNKDTSSSSSLAAKWSKRTQDRSIVKLWASLDAVPVRTTLWEYIQYVCGLPAAGGFHHEVRIVQETGTWVPPGGSGMRRPKRGKVAHQLVFTRCSILLLSPNRSIRRMFSVTSLKSWLVVEESSCIVLLFAFATSSTEVGDVDTKKPLLEHQVQLWSEDPHGIETHLKYVIATMQAIRQQWHAQSAAAAAVAAAVKPLDDDVIGDDIGDKQQQRQQQQQQEYRPHMTLQPVQQPQPQPQHNLMFLPQVAGEGDALLSPDATTMEGTPPTTSVVGTVLGNGDGGADQTPKHLWRLYELHVRQQFPFWATEAHELRLRDVPDLLRGYRELVPLYDAQCCKIVGLREVIPPEREGELSDHGEADAGVSPPSQEWAFVSLRSASWRELCRVAVDELARGREALVRVASIRLWPIGCEITTDAHVDALDAQHNLCEVEFIPVSP